MNNARKKRLLVIEHDPDMCDMLAVVLEQQGQDVRCLLVTNDVVAEARSHQPDLIVFDFLPTEEAASNALLGDLRADPATAAIPVVVLTAIEAVAERVKANYNVRVAITKPFDVSLIQREVREAIDSPRVAGGLTSAEAISRAGTPREQARTVLAQHSREAMVAWVGRLRSEPPWRDRPDLRLAGLMDEVPTLIEVVVASLGAGGPEGYFQQNPDALDRARAHASVRVQQGIGLWDAVREYKLLRDEIVETYRRHLPPDYAADDLLTLVRIVNKTLDRIVETTIAEYTAAREREKAS